MKIFAAALIMVLSPALARSAGVAIVAHRGASHDAPENTLAAFQLAWQQGADAIEGDFHLTKDGRIVCIHDSTTKRTADADLTVAKSTFNQLRELEVGSWKEAAWTGEKIPSLEEVLAVVPLKKRIFIEIKCGPEIVQPLKRVLGDSGLKPDQVVIISFNSKVIATAKRELPHIKAFWLTGYKQDKASSKWKPTLHEIFKTLEKINADGLDSQAQDWIDQAFVQSIKGARWEFHAWTVDDPVQAARLSGLGIDSITTNRPQWLRRQLKMK